MIYGFSGVDDFSGTFNGFVNINLFTQQQLIEGNITQMMAGLKDVSFCIAERVNNPLFCSQL